MPRSRDRRPRLSTKPPYFFVKISLMRKDEGFYPDLAALHSIEVNNGRYQREAFLNARKGSLGIKERLSLNLRKALLNSRIGFSYKEMDLFYLITNL